MGWLLKHSLPPPRYATVLKDGSVRRYLPVPDTYPCMLFAPTDFSTWLKSSLQNSSREFLKSFVLLFNVYIFSAKPKAFFLNASRNEEHCLIFVLCVAKRSSFDFLLLKVYTVFLCGKFCIKAYFYTSEPLLAKIFCLSEKKKFHELKFFKEKSQLFLPFTLFQPRFTCLFSFMITSCWLLINGKRLSHVLRFVKMTLYVYQPLRFNILSLSLFLLLFSYDVYPSDDVLPQRRLFRNPLTIKNISFIFYISVFP